MKQHLYLIFLVPFLVFIPGCQDFVTALNEAIKEAETQQVKAKEPAPLAWGTTRPDWDKALRDAIASVPSIKAAKNPCKTLDHNECLAQLLSKMAEFESGFKPTTTFIECNKTKCVYSDGCTKHATHGYCMKGNPKIDGGLVISKGLYQMSYGSVSSSKYGCELVNEGQLFDPLVNIKCAVRIATRWIAEDKVFVGTSENSKLGTGRYWSVSRPTSKSYAKIQDYMSKF